MVSDETFQGAAAGSKKKLLLLSVSAGAGHVRAAEALQAEATRSFPGWQAEHLDVMEFVPRLFKRIYADSYLSLVNRHPVFWGYLYQATDQARPDSTLTRLRKAFEGLNTRKLTARLRAANPDAVVCTHFLPAQLLSKLRRDGAFAQPSWVVITDFDVHSLWVHPHLTGYAVASDEVAARLRDRGLDQARIAVTGIPVHPVFAAPPARAVAAAKLGLDPLRPIIALMSGGFGVGAIDLMAERLLSIPGDHQVLALAGRNAPLLQRLEALAAAHRGRLRPLGYTREIEVVMAAADLAVTKPGGLTTSECLAVGLPLIVVSPIPGQEERNSDHLLEHGAALKAHDLAGLEFRVRQLLREPARLERLRLAARALGRPDAARRILDLALGSS